MKSKIILGFLLCSVCYIAGWTVGTHTHTMVINTVKDPSVVKTVAHLTVSNPDYELLWSSVEEDIAYYRYIGERSLAKQGDTVYTYTNDKCEIINTSLLGFTIETETILPVGTSGTIIKNSKGEVIGYISESIGNNQYYCIWN